jgi:DNA-binding transcriptional ArsR family regulator
MRSAFTLARHQRIGLAQPQVSKHLRVLREVELVDVRDDGRQRLYRLNGHALKPIHDWVKQYEYSWSERFERLDVVLEELKQNEEGDDGSDE